MDLDLDIVVDASQVLGAVDDGFPLAMWALQGGRVGIAAQALGIGDAAVKMPADAVEIMNPWATPQENKLAEELARTRNLPSVAGSDAHKPEQMFKGYTEVFSEPNVKSVLEAIRNGKVKVAPTKHYLNARTSLNL